MSENIEMNPVEAVETTKPYTFRMLGAPDVFLMFKIIKAIGINEFMACLQGDSLKSMLNMFMESNGNEGDQDDVLMFGALAGVLEIANVIIGNLPKCEREIYQLLAQTSNLTEDEIKAEGNAVMFVEMVIDFIKKPEFKDFIKVVSKLFK